MRPSRTASTVEACSNSRSNINSGLPIPTDIGGSTPGQPLTFTRKLPWRRKDDHFLFDIPINLAHPVRQLVMPTLVPVVILLSTAVYRRSPFYRPTPRNALSGFVRVDLDAYVHARTARLDRALQD